MPLIIVGHRRGTLRHEPYSVPIVMHAKHGSSKPNRYKPHTGAKEMRKAAARIKLAMFRQTVAFGYTE